MGTGSTSSFPFHAEFAAVVFAPAEAVFEHLDDPRRLSAHMSRTSWMMAGSHMTIDLDAAKGRVEGARIRLSGRVLGISLRLDEIVTERQPSRRKVWQTIGTPRLLVIGPYRMGYEITPDKDSCLLRVFIDYAMPDAPVARWLGPVLGRAYARWCTRRMVNDAVRHFRSRHDRPAANASTRPPARS